MKPDIALLLLGLVLALGMFLSRRLQRGYIDFLTPMLAMYGLHFLTRGMFVFYWPDWLFLNPLVASATEPAIGNALSLGAAGVVVLTLSYLAMRRVIPATEIPVSRMATASLRSAASLLGLGCACRLLLRLATEDIITLPDWSMNPIDTVGWAALAGVFLAAFTWGRSTIAAERTVGGFLAIIGVLAIVGVDGRLSMSREATLQPILAVCMGRMIGAGASLRRIAMVAALVGLPIFLWIGAMKTYHGYDIGPGSGYVGSVSAVREQFGLDWAQFVFGSVQDRFHGLDSLIVCRAIVPSRQPFEDGSVWLQVLLSAFVPRAFFPGKQVGWGARFAVEFWGLRPEVEGSAAVGISHLGEFYIYGGDRNCLAGMAILGAALGLLAQYLRRRSDTLGLTMFVMIALTICQVDRDLEVTLGGVLKLLVIYAALVALRRRGGRRSRVPRLRRAPHAQVRSAPGSVETFI